MSDVIVCPECGFSNDVGLEWCDSCGVPLPQPQAKGQPKPAREWLESGDEITLRCDLSALLASNHHLSSDPTHAQLHFVIKDSSEVSSVRRISQLSLIEVIDPVSELMAATLKEQLFILEELGPMLGTQHPQHPNSIKELLRVPLAESLHQGHRLRLFLHENMLSLEELVIESQGQLTPRQIRRIFRALLSTVSDLHSRGYLFLRLSPWTVHMSREILKQKDFNAQAFVSSLSEETSVEGKSSAQDDAQGQAPAQAQSDDDEVIFAHDETLEVDKRELGLELTTPEHSFDPSQEQGRVNALAQTADLDVIERPAVSGPDAFEELPDADESPTLSADAVDSHDGPRTLTDFEGYSSLGAELSNHPGSSARAMLDGSFRLFGMREERMEIPVIMGFSAPEMFSRTRTEIGVACDVFSLGMILYFMIAGELPPTSVYTRHTPALPARNFRPEFPLGLHSVISRATRPDPRERFTSIESMQDAFERACDLIEERLTSAETARSPMLKVSVERHIGITKKLRNPVNQDNVFGASSDDGRFSLVVVADGVSTASYGSGDLASECLRQAAEDAWEHLLPTYLSDSPIDEYEIIHGILERANRKIIEYVNANCLPFKGNPHEVMGSTALVSIIYRGHVTLGSLGDSRAYLQRGQAFEQITTDHNLWTLSVLDGVLADNALALPHGDALARCLGTFYLDEERLVAIPPQPDMFRFPVVAGDLLLLATDGLMDFAGPNALAAEDNILSILLSEPNPDLASLELILLANRGGGGDNIGVGIVRFT